MLDSVTRDEIREAFVRLADGERALIEPAFALIRPTVAGYCARLVGVDDGADATQATLLKVFERVTTFERDADPLTWALAIATWECRTIRRRRARRRESALPAGAEATLRGDDDPERSVADAEIHAALREIVGGLSDIDRASIDRFALMDDATPPLDATARKRRERALDRLRDAWRRTFGQSR